MKTQLTASAAIVVSLGMPLSAHRVDEYLQATLISVDKNRMQAQIRLVPGIAVFPIVLADIDTDRDGVISEPEQQAYAQRVLRDLSLTINGDLLRPQLVSKKFPVIDDMKEGLGEIQIEFGADLPVNRSIRKLTLENHHQSRIAAYMVNCLAPRDPDIRVVAQNRNYTQSFYELDYTQASARSGRMSFPPSSGGAWLTTLALFFFARLVLLFRQRFRQDFLASSDNGQSARRPSAA